MVPAWRTAASRIAIEVDRARWMLVAILTGVILLGFGLWFSQADESSPRPGLRTLTSIDEVQEGITESLESVEVPDEAAARSTEEASAFVSLMSAIRQTAARSLRRSTVGVAEIDRQADRGVAPNQWTTGVVLNEQGEILTLGYGPTSPDRQIVVRDAQDRIHRAEWNALDPLTGLSLIRIEPRLIEPVTVADEPKLWHGMEVLLVGNPYGLALSTSLGHISGLDRTLLFEPGQHPLGHLIQINVALYPGDLGAVVGDMQGRWLGLVRSGLPTTESDSLAPTTALAFAIPAAEALWIVDQLRTWGEVRRAYLGVNFDASSLFDKPGVLLRSIVPDTPAAHVGLHKEDRIVAVNGMTVRSHHDLIALLDTTLAGTIMNLTVIRDGQSTSLEVITSQRRPRPCSPSLREPATLNDGVDRLTQAVEEPLSRETDLNARMQPGPESSSVSISDRPKEDNTWISDTELEADGPHDPDGSSETRQGVGDGRTP